MGAGAWRGPRGWGGGGVWTLKGPQGRSFVRTFAHSLGRTEIPPVFYRTSSPLGPLPKREEAVVVVELNERRIERKGGKGKEGKGKQASREIKTLIWTLLIPITKRSKKK